MKNRIIILSLCLFSSLNSFSQSLDDLLKKLVVNNSELKAVHSRFLAAQEKIEQEIESNIALEYLQKCHEYHSRWIQQTNTTVLKLDVNDNVEVADQISIIPTWGIRRNIGNHFTYETGIGIGYLYYFAKDAGYAENESDVAVNLHLRIGYRF